MQTARKQPQPPGLCCEAECFGETWLCPAADEGYRIAVRRQNEEMTKNQHILSRIIDRVKFCGACELALRGHEESKSSDNPGIFRGLVDFVASLDGVLNEHLENAAVFKGTSRTVQNELLDCMCSVLKEHVIKEAQSSDFLSIQADETVDIATQCQLVLVLRYIDAKNTAGKVSDIILGHTRERFSFTNYLVSATLLQGDRLEL
ncbi:hypothetical protein MHYP_G00364000 [Metynnis hypsauchen]